MRLLPKTRGGKYIFGILLSFLAVLAAAMFVALSVWIEDRFPSDDAKRALLPAGQRMVTKPVVDALSRQAERYVRRKSEAAYMNTGYTMEETIARFLDESVDLAERRIYAYRLARIGSPEAVAALLKIFKTASPEHKAFMAQLIGSTGNPAAKEWLWPLLADPNDAVVIAAIHGLSAIGGEDVVARVGQILADSQQSEKIRIEAAAGLGSIGNSSSREILVAAFSQNPPAGLATQILGSLGHFEFAAVADTFGTYLAAPGTSQAMRVVAVEALANSSGEAVPFLLDLAAKDFDPDVRASSAWAISAHQSVNDLGPTLVNLTAHEPVADVRRRLYEALLPQSDIAADELLPMVQAETDIAARVAGFNVLGRNAGQNPVSAAARTFNDHIVPELVEIATKPNSLNIQMRAVFALRRAQTDSAQAALAVVAKSAPPQIAKAAQNGLRPPKI